MKDAKRKMQNAKRLRLATRGGPWMKPLSREERGTAHSSWGEGSALRLALSAPKGAL